MSKKFAGIIAAAIIGSLLVPGIASAATASASGNNSCWDYKDSERAFARKANKERTDKGEGKLKLDPELSKVALKHTKEMVAADSLFHTSSDQLRARVKNWSLLGENVGVGSSVSSLHTAFMNSPAHAANILNANFGHQGVGVVKKGDRMWVTVIFSSDENPNTTLSMPNC